MAQRGRGAAAGSRPAAHRDVPRAERDLGPARDAGVLRGRVRSIVEPAVTAAGFDLEELSVTRAGRRHVVRVTVDADGGIGHSELSDVSREVSMRLDAAEETGGELTAGAYTLEVSSPGVDRPLTLARHWRRNIGRLVKVKASDRTLTGRIVAVDDGSVTLDIEGGRQALAFADLGPGRVQVEFRELASETIEVGRELASETIEVGRELASETIEVGRELASETVEVGRELASETITGTHGEDHGAHDDGDRPREQEDGA
jgi:ribosome maturation factor RimP